MPARWIQCVWILQLLKNLDTFGCQQHKWRVEVSKCQRERRLQRLWQVMMKEKNTQRNSRLPFFVFKSKYIHILLWIVQFVHLMPGHSHTCLLFHLQLVFLYPADQSRLRHYAQYFWSALFTQNVLVSFSSCLLPELSSRRDPFLLPFFFLFLFFCKMLQLIKTVISESQ